MSTLLSTSTTILLGPLELKVGLGLGVGVGVEVEAVREAVEGVVVRGHGQAVVTVVSILKLLRVLLAEVQALAERVIVVD